MPCIAGNAKKMVIIALSTINFGMEISFLNGAGIAVVLMGSSLHGYISVQEKISKDQGGFHSIAVSLIPVVGSSA